MIVDDSYIIVGSANINERSMSGTRDTEMAAGWLLAATIQQLQPLWGGPHVPNVFVGGASEDMGGGIPVPGNPRVHPEGEGDVQLQLAELQLRGVRDGPDGGPPGPSPSLSCAG